MLLFLAAIPISTAQEMQRAPGEIVVCPAKYEDQFSRMGMGQMALKNALKKASHQQKKRRLLNCS